MSKNCIYISLLSLLTFASCEKEKMTPVNTSNDTITEVHYASDPDYALANKNAQELVVHFENEQKNLQKKLKKANKKEAEALFIDYYKKLSVIVDSISVAETNTLNTYHSLGNTKPDSIIRKEKLYEKLGLYFRKLDSTKYDFKIKPGYFYNLFHKKISSEYEQYLKLRFKEHKLLYDLQFKNKKITLQDQRELIINWEKFILKHKDFKFIDLAKKSYTDNLTMYLFGTPEKPTFEISAKKLYMENEQEYISFVKNNPKLISAEITKKFLKHFYVNDKNFTAEEFYIDLKEFTKAEIAERIK
ncbi:hypothetical protein MG290_02770 [Flavobacterium sp. CBA20B-1]|uniref:hypothetical protein n=1 Tax=unclassified Flavobacterium TaxID=196869 RepID=UPI0022240FE2|nr:MULTISPECIES: hypothetical protein [unclassified Flavobacterium]WCM42614.1 hypothetical protein MG290_02770 [Flavobacterium sp. CBA20B-1]